MTTHLINGKAKISLTKPTTTGQGNTFSIYLETKDYENLGSPKVSYVYVGPNPNNRNGPSSLICKLGHAPEGSGLATRSWGKSGNTATNKRLAINSRMLNFPMPQFMFRSFEVPVTFDRENQTIVFHDSPMSLWKMAEKQKFKGLKRGYGNGTRKTSKSKGTTISVTSLPKAVAVKGGELRGGEFAQGMSGALDNIVADFNRGISALRVLGVPHELKTAEDGGVVLEIKAATLR